jgi:glycosyltransferase involved in cell wall biosynthesis
MTVGEERGTRSRTIAHLMTSVSRGGLELYVRELIVQLAGAGVNQVVVCDANSILIESCRAAKIPVEILKPGSRYSPFRIFRLHQIDKKYGVALWHSHQRDDMILVALAFFFRKSIRHIFSLYMGFAHKKDLLHRLVYRRVEKLVMTSELMNQLALARLPVRKDQLQCIRYGRDDSGFRKAAKKKLSVRKTLGIKTGQKLVISLSRLDPMKGVREFAEAARLLDNRVRGRFVFVQIGERTIIGYNDEKKPVYLPESEDTYRALVAAERGAQSNRYYRLLPFQKDYLPYLCAADYFILGSYDEMYSLSMIDAMMAGCLVIGTNNGGTVEQVGKERGMLIESRSATAMTAALLQAEANGKTAEKMRKASWKWVMQEHTWKAVLPQWLKLYSNASF